MSECTEDNDEKGTRGATRSLQEVKKASVFKKAFAAEAALYVAVELFEKIVEEIETLKACEGGANNETRS
jgi:hypothetical protein